MLHAPQHAYHRVSSFPRAMLPFLPHVFSSPNICISKCVRVWIYIYNILCCSSLCLLLHMLFCDLLEVWFHVCEFMNSYVYNIYNVCVCVCVCVCVWYICAFVCAYSWICYTHAPYVYHIFTWARKRLCICAPASMNLPLASKCRTQLMRGVNSCASMPKHTRTLFTVISPGLESVWGAVASSVLSWCVSVCVNFLSVCVHTYRHRHRHDRKKCA